jgi:hypothetical protein
MALNMLIAMIEYEAVGIRSGAASYSRTYIRTFSPLMKSHHPIETAAASASSPIERSEIA